MSIAIDAHDDDDDELYYSLNCLIARHTCFANRGDSIMSSDKGVLINVEEYKAMAREGENEASRRFGK